jgi:hypothetical protein
MHNALRGMTGNKTPCERDIRGRFGNKTPVGVTTKPFVGLVTKPRVPHISLVFREMWDTTSLNRRLSTERTKTHG